MKKSCFKNAIKTKKPSNCPCRLCKQYIAGVGFICPVIYNVGLLHYIHFFMITMGKSVVEERKEREQKKFFFLSSFFFLALVIAIVVILIVRGSVDLN